MPLYNPVIQVSDDNAAASDYVTRIKLAADTTGYRLITGLDGSSNGAITFGAGGSSAQDTRLYRPATAGVLLVDANGQSNATELRVDGTSGQLTKATVRVAGESNPRIVLEGDATTVGLLMGPGGATAPDWQLTRTAANTAALGSTHVLDANAGKLRLPTAAGITLTTTEAYIGEDSTPHDLLMYDSQRSRVIGSVGWQAYAVPVGYGSTALLAASSLAANGGTAAIQIPVTGHMLLQAVYIWNTDTSTARSWNWSLYKQYLNNGNAGENSLTRVAVGTAADSFTPGAASMRNIAASGAPIYLGPGIYWLAVQNVHASNTFGLGNSTTGTAATFQYWKTKTTTNPNGSTLDFVAVTWAMQTGVPFAALDGRVFGQTTGW